MSDAYTISKIDRSSGSLYGKRVWIKKSDAQVELLKIQNKYEKPGLHFKIVKFSMNAEQADNLRRMGYRIIK